MKSMKILALVILSAIMINCGHDTSENSPASFPLSSVSTAQIQPPQFLHFSLEEYRVEKDTVKSGETLAGILHSRGLSNKRIFLLTQALDTLFDPRNLRKGKVYYMIYSQNDSMPEAFVYRTSPADYEVIYLRDSTDRLFEKIHKPVRYEKKAVSVPINNSLFYDLQQRNLSPVLALKLSDIYAWTVDFFHLRPRDKFKALYTDRYVDTTYLGVGDIEAAVFYHYGDTLYAFRYEYDTLHHLYDYFDEQGHTLRKQFLKSPIKFGRITSRYTMRRYVKIYGRVKPHLGTDFAAPVGTPIMATADGVVEIAGYTRGNGNYIKIRHNSTYSTQYLHMRNFAKGIKPGVRVKQGQVIGYVGMTGFTTGPHVCYRFWKNGKQVDPFKQKLPEAKSLDSTLLPDYLKYIAPLKQKLDALP